MSAGGAVADVTAELTVTSFHPGHRSVGGGIAIGRDATGALRRVLLRPEVLGRPPAESEAWRFTGRLVVHPEYGEQVAAAVALPLLPRGRALVRFLATSPRVKGVGWKTATALWDALGEDLYAILERRDAAALAGAVGPQLACGIIEGFGLLADEVRVFAWLDRYGVSPRTASAAAALWGGRAAERIQSDPYALALLEPWSQVDERALRLGVGLQDERRLLAAVEEAGARRWHLAHTASSRECILSLVGVLLGRAGAAAPAAFDLAVRTGRLVQVSPGGDAWQTRAPHVMERSVEAAVQERLARGVAAPGFDAVEAAIAAVEAEEGYRLTRSQREAVHMAVSSPISVIAGGAGTGKTSVVKAILRARQGHRAGGVASEPYPCIALAGRAARRISEATGAEAMTIHRFLKRLEVSRPEGQGLLIIDESSMVDLPTTYRILRRLPEAVSICWIGDPGQLPPIGAGLVFHRMAEAAGIPRVVLDTVHRQSGISGIPQVAADIRAGRWPRLPDFDPSRPDAEGVFLVRCEGSRTAMETLRVWESLVGPPPSRNDPGGLARLHEADVQVLCPMRGGPSGAKALSDEVEYRWMANQATILDWGLRVGSKVLWVKNDYERPTGRTDDEGSEVVSALMNGTLGVVRAPKHGGAWLAWDDGQDLAVDAHDLKKMARGWCISVHKAQGSAWRRIIAPITRSRLLDRTLVYTAVTRARSTVVLVGDECVLRAAVEAPPSAFRRSVAFDPTRAISC